MAYKTMLICIMHISIFFLPAGILPSFSVKVDLIQSSVCLFFLFLRFKCHIPKPQIHYSNKLRIYISINWLAVTLLSCNWIKASNGSVQSGRLVISRGWISCSLPKVESHIPVLQMPNFKLWTTVWFGHQGCHAYYRAALEQLCHLHR